MFEIKVVHNCPVTRASQGRVTLPPWLIADIVGTLDREKGEEWLIFFHGTRSEDGLEVLVESVSVPEDQKRHSTEVDIGERTFGDDVVGVLHSHHSMSAHFSPTDNTKLNPRFAFSIVVSENLADDEATWLGFSYQAEGRVKLPCGAVGVVPFVVQPEGVEDWPLQIEPYIDVDESPELGDCAHMVTSDEPTDRWHQKRYAACELLPTEIVLNVAAFGRGTDELSKLLPPPVKQWNWQGGGRQGHGYEPAEPKVVEAYDNLMRCDNCGWFEDFGDLEWIDRKLLCLHCVEWYARTVLVDDQSGLLASGLSPLEEAALWEERLAEVAAREGGIYD